MYGGCKPGTEPEFVCFHREKEAISNSWFLETLSRADCGRVGGVRLEPFETLGSKWT